jgi:chromosomal replication initiator protein
MPEQTHIDVKKAWEDVLELLSGIKETNSERAKGILAYLNPDHVEDGVFYVTTTLLVAKQWTEQKYAKYITDALQLALNVPLRLTVILDDEDAVIHTAAQTTNNEPPLITPSSTPAVVIPQSQFPTTEPNAFSPNAEISIDSIQPQFLQNKTFETFVVGDSNRLAYSAAQGAAETPGVKFNPLFIYGRSGLGKTHLLLAIYNYILSYHKYLKIVYEPVSTFVTEYTTSLSKDKMLTKFRNKYYHADVLLLDDVQTLEGKTETTNMLFDIFNDFIMQNKAIVLSSDRAPADIDLDERYRSRFAMGITVNIQKPTFEMKVAIFNNFKDLYCKNYNISKVDLDDEVTNYIVSLSGPNMRELDAAAANLINFVYAQYINNDYRALTIDVVKDVVKGAFTHGKNDIKIIDIQHAVEKAYGIKHDDLLGHSKQRDITTARQIAMYLSRTLTNKSYPEIGRAFNKDHSAVIYGEGNVNTKYMRDPIKKAEIENLMSKLKNL